jgi:hypothetical protein
MWRLLTSTYHLVQVRVLHPLLGPNRFTPIQRGLPEGSRLSPILFGIFMSELLRQLEKDFPFAYTYTSKGNIWLGAIAYVDDLVLISKSPHELQAMLNTCQSWCEKSRVEINLEKTKIMIFNSRLQQTPNPPSHTWSITAQYAPSRIRNTTTAVLPDETTHLLALSADKDTSARPPRTNIRL